MKLEDVLKEDSELIEEKFKEVCQSVHYLSQEELSPLPEAIEYTFSAGEGFIFSSQNGTATLNFPELN